MAQKVFAELHPGDDNVSTVNLASKSVSVPAAALYSLHGPCHTGLSTSVIVRCRGERVMCFTHRTE
jgi:hypothetical protein